MRGRALRRMAADLAVRRPATVEQAAERAHRGRALVDQALTAARDGRPLPDLPTTAPPVRPAPRVEVTACRRCYAPHEAPPDSLCGNCQDIPQPLGDLVNGPTPPPEGDDHARHRI